MLFNSYIFIFLFLPLTVLGYFGLQKLKQDKLAMGYLLAMSLWFYGYGSKEYLGLLMIGILVNFLLAAGMARITGHMGRKILLLSGVGWNIGTLFCFKYYDFFIENMNEAWKTDIDLLRLALPLGISFYTFQHISYLVDSYRGEVEEYSLLEYAVYIAFFPKMVQGPIAYHYEIIPALREERNKQLNYVNLSKGIYAFSLGLAKKVLIADTLAKMVTLGYEETGYMNTASAVLVMICYSLQIYFDFSGYCDMAMGIGLFFNVELPNNFLSPYKADSIDSFWDRWHMTLTRFFTKYVYFPLGGSRKGVVRTYVNIMIVFLLSGLWHGANWTFIIWGAMHGVAKVFDRLCKKLIVKIPKVIRVSVTFAFTTLAWSIFRADSFEQVKELWGDVFFYESGGIHSFLTDVFNELLEVTIVSRIGFSSLISAYPSCLLLVFVVCVLATCFFMRNTQEKLVTMRLTNGKIIVIVVLMMWSIVSLSDVSEFLYVNF